MTDTPFSLLGLKEGRWLVNTHPDGIYLNQPFDDYLEDGALGYSALKALLTMPPEWWWSSSWNTLLPEEEKPAPHFDLGKALHVAWFEGIDVYDRTYGVPPEAADYPNHLNSLNDLKEECRKLLLPVSGTKEELIARIIKRRPDAPLFNVVRDAWIDEGRTPIKPEQDTRVRLLHRMLERARLPEDYGGETVAEVFLGGLSEVSVFWTDERGIRQRARFDKLKANISLDGKTINGWNAKDFRQSLLKDIVIRGYVLQWAHYHEARRQMRELFATKQVFGATEVQMDVLEEICAAEDWSWGWIFAKTSGAPMVKVIIPPLPSPQFAKAEIQRAKALDNFQYYRDFFGLEAGAMWTDPEVLWEPSHTDWPAWSELPETT